MTYRTVPVNIVGPSFENRSLAVSNQLTKNLYPEVNSSGKTMALHNWPGIDSLSTLSGSDRGYGELNGTLYQVVSTTLYSIDSSGTKTSIGTIAGTNRCIFAEDGTNLIITTGGTGYIYNGSTLSTISDSDFSNANTVAVIGRAAIYDNQTDNKFYAANVGDPATIASNNSAFAESVPSTLQGVYAFNEKVYLFTDKHFETWYYSGSGNPPLDKIPEGTSTIGIGSIHSAANTENFLYFFGTDRRVYQIQAYQPRPISDHINKELRELTTVSDCHAWTITHEGGSFYVLQFPAEDRTFCYSETVNDWFELSTDTGANENRYLGNSYKFIYGKHMLASATSGDTLELNFDTYTDNTLTSERMRITAPLDGDSLGIPGQRIEMNRFELLMEFGVGTPSGAGSSPVVYVEFSFDLGNTWTNPTATSINLGVSGDRRIRAELYHVESFYQMIAKVYVTDPVKVTIYSANIDVRPAGW